MSRVAGQVGIATDYELNSLSNSLSVLVSFTVLIIRTMAMSDRLHQGIFVDHSSELLFSSMTSFLSFKLHSRWFFFPSRENHRKKYTRPLVSREVDNFFTPLPPPASYHSFSIYNWCYPSDRTIDITRVRNYFEITFDRRTRKSLYRGRWPKVPYVLLLCVTSRRS